MENEKILRRIRKKVFVYSEEEYAKARRIIEKLKARIIAARPSRPFKHWMYACE